MQGWETFFMVTATAGVTLVGLMFVVVTVMSDRKKTGDDIGLKTFLTPTVFHFVAVFVSALVILSPKTATLAGSFGLLLGTGGLFYIATLAVRLGGERLAGLGWRGWPFHILLPALGYLLLVLAGLQSGLAYEYFAASEVVLLLVGMRNAWAAAIAVSLRSSN